MDIAAGAVGAVADLLIHGKAKLVKVKDGPAADSGGGLGGALAGAANAVASALPIPGLGSSDPDDEITCMFNPSTYSLKQDLTVEASKDKYKAGGELEYQYTGPMTLSMTLMFDDFASAQGDVTPKINKLLSWQRPAGDGSRPPLVKFVWKNTELDDFQGFITSVTANYTVFRKDGTPIQAKVDISIEGTKQAAPGKNPTSHALDMRRVHTVVEGETLQNVAHAELGRPEYWRALAEANDIDDPLRVRPGRAVLVPSAADAARFS